MAKKRNKGLRKSRENATPRYRPFKECLWCGNSPIPEPTYLQVNYFCDMECSMTAMRCIRMTGLSRQRGGAGIQGVILGLLMQSLSKADPDGITGANWIAKYYEMWRTDWGKRLNSRNVSQFIRTYVNPECFHTVKPPSNNQPTLYYFTKGTCLKEWLKT